MSHADMKLIFLPGKGLYVEPESGERLELRDFYINKRIASGIKIATLERLSGVTHPLLQLIEKPYPNKKRNNSPTAMLAALEGLGFEIVIRKKS